MDSRPAIACNMVNASSPWSAGSKAYIATFAGDGVSRRIVVRSRSGRWIETWVKSREITNIRQVTLHKGDPRFDDVRIPTMQIEAYRHTIDAIKEP